MSHLKGDRVPAAYRSTMKELALSRVYQLIEPGPVVLLSTCRDGKANLMTLSWHMMVAFEPPAIACVVSRADYSHAALRTTRECVIGVPDVSLARTVVEIGNCSGDDTDKFAAFGLTALPARHGGAPLIAECFANLECRVIDTRLVNRFDLFVLEVLNGWIDPRHAEHRTIHHRGYGTFVVDGETISLPSKMR